MFKSRIMDEIFTAMDNKWSKARSLTRTVGRMVQEYCQQSSLHGLKYISNPDLPYIERSMWLLVFLTCVGVSIHLIWDVYEFWKEKPFLITFDSHVTPVWSVPFPAITICTHFAVKRSVVDLATVKNKTALFYASLLCPLPDLLRAKVPEIEYINNEFYDFVKQVSPNCSEMMKRCFFWNQEVDCCSLFDPVMTKSGMCHIFNNLPFSKIFSNNTYVPFPSKTYPEHTRYWSPETGYPQPDLRGQNGSFTYPRWAQLAGETFGVSVELFQNISEWQLECSGAHSGFKVSLSTPADLPLHPQINFHLSMNRETSMMLTPETLMSRKGLESVSPRVRSCAFRGEKPLHYFNQYTQTNCNIECIAKRYIRKCGCVPIYYPRGQHIRICSRRKDGNCLKRARTAMTRSAMQKGVQSRRRVYSLPCDCLRGCQELSYRSAQFYTDFIYTGKDPPWANGQHLGENGVTRVTVYFRANQFLGKHRSIRYTNLKFAGTCGGLLSLLLGFSVISLIEVFYCFLLRPISQVMQSWIPSRSRTVPQTPKSNVIIVKPQDLKIPS